MKNSDKTEKPFFTPKDVAEKSGKSMSWIRQCLRSGKLEAEKHGRQYIITPEQYDRWKSNQLPVGRPKKGEA